MDQKPLARSIGGQDAALAPPWVIYDLGAEIGALMTVLPRCGPLCPRILSTQAFNQEHRPPRFEELLKVGQNLRLTIGHQQWSEAAYLEKQLKELREKGWWDGSHWKNKVLVRWLSSG